MNAHAPPLRPGVCRISDSLLRECYGPVHPCWRIRRRKQRRKDRKRCTARLRAQNLDAALAEVLLGLRSLGLRASRTRSRAGAGDDDGGHAQDLTGAQVLPEHDQSDQGGDRGIDAVDDDDDSWLESAQALKFRARERTTGNRQMQGSCWRRRSELNR
jgi:hypothetical protein